MSRQYILGALAEYIEEYGGSARSMMRLILSRCQRYAAHFGPGAESMLFTGGPGLGKTFLSACIARSVADGGHSVVYETAIRLFGDFESAKFGDYSEENQSRTEKYLRCDLLIMDDLGSEMVTQFSQSALYTVVNTRLMENRPTIISTNLTPEGLQARYTPAICSRILGACSSSVRTCAAKSNDPTPGMENPAGRFFSVSAIAFSWKMR